MILALLLACTGAKPGDTADTSADTSDTSVDTSVPCTPWLPWDVPGATWDYVDADGVRTRSYTAEGPATWEYGTHAALRNTGWQGETAIDGGRTFLTCTSEGLAMIGADTVYDGLRYVSYIEPPALWMPRAPAVGDSWGAASEVAMDIYDADGAFVERQGAPMEYTMTATGTTDVTVPAGTFSALVVDFEGISLTYADGIGEIAVAQDGYEDRLSAYTVP